MKNTHPLIVAMLIALMVGVSGPATAAEATPKPTTEQMTSFKRKVKDRDTLYRKLQQLDRQAADALKRGEKPVQIYAEQTSVQSRLDLLELQVDLFTTRFEMETPPPPSAATADAKTGKTKVNTSRAFAIGQRRAEQQVSDDCRRMLATINFQRFLNQDIVEVEQE